MGIELPLLWGLGGLGLLGLGVGLATGFLLGRRSRRGPPPPVFELACALCRLNAQVAADPELARLLLVFVEAPRRLDRVERVRARAWFDSARRLHRLLIEAESVADADRAALLPSMGEPAQGAGTGMHAAPANITLLDPEFFALVEAIRERAPRP